MDQRDYVIVEFFSSFDDENNFAAFPSTSFRQFRRLPVDILPLIIAIVSVVYFFVSVTLLVVVLVLIVVV